MSSSPESESQNASSSTKDAPTIASVCLPTGEEIRGQDSWHNCVVLGVVSALMGFWLKSFNRRPGTRKGKENVAIQYSYEEIMDFTLKLLWRGLFLTQRSYPR